MKFLRKYIIGIDEVGRGPLAGPVTVCAVICSENIYKKLKKNKNLPKSGKDSKKLSKLEREKYSKVLKGLALDGDISYKIIHISNKIIDSKGISYAISKAIQKSLDDSKVDPKISHILLDGSLKAPIEYKYQKTIIKGDEKEKIISWASILAKVSRDSLMQKLHKKVPDYGFAVHMGYGTSMHRIMIKKVGLSVYHRQSFCKRLIF